MNEECDCGYCGKCASQLEHQRYIENLRGYGIPSWEDEQEAQEKSRAYDTWESPK